MSTRAPSAPPDERAHARARRYETHGAVAVAPQVAPTPEPRRRTEPRPRHLRVVAPTARARRRLTPAVAVAGSAVVFALCLAVVAAHTMLVQGQVRLDGLDDQLAVEQARYQDLRTQVAELESPSRIVAAAHERGMVTPDDLVYLQPPAVDLADLSGGGVGPAPPSGGPVATEPILANPSSSPWSAMKPLLEPPAP